VFPASFRVYGWLVTRLCGHQIFVLMAKTIADRMKVDSCVVSSVCTCRFRDFHGLVYKEAAEKTPPLTVM
jgi:hypothetical protein